MNCPWNSRLEMEKKKPGNGLCMFVVLNGKVLQNANGIEFHNITIEFMFAGINMFWARLRLILARAARRGLK